ncbi:MAG TPA: hypothetical protein VII99_14270 [Bacteroidia bacterium]
MNLIDNIKNSIGNYFLSQEVKSLRRDKAFLNLEEARSIGIVFDATANEDFELVKKYIGYLRDMKKRVKAIGFFNMKVSPPMAYSKLEYDFFNQKDLNWHNVPNNVYVKNFIDDDYDILIDLNLKDLLALKYISALSKSKFKVGMRSGSNHSIFDLMIDADASKGMKYFLRNIDAYLFIINKNHEKQFTADE